MGNKFWETDPSIWDSINNTGLRYAAFHLVRPDESTESSPCERWRFFQTSPVTQFSFFLFRMTFLSQRSFNSWEKQETARAMWNVVRRVNCKIKQYSLALWHNNDLTLYFHLSGRGHYFFSVYASRMMVAQGHGLIVTISSMGGLRYLFNVPYGVGKAAVGSHLVPDLCYQEPNNMNVHVFYNQVRRCHKKRFLVLLFAVRQAGSRHGHRA